MGFAAGRQAALERIQNVRGSGGRSGVDSELIENDAVVVAIERLVGTEMSVNFECKGNTGSPSPVHPKWRYKNVLTKMGIRGMSCHNLLALLLFVIELTLFFSISASY